VLKASLSSISAINRKKITKNRSGGIMVGFKDNLAKHIDIVNTDSKYVMWFKCSEQLFKTDQPVFFGVVYIPPEYTKSTCRFLIKSTKSVSVAVLALKSPKRHIYLDLFEKDKYSCCNSLKASSGEYLVYSGGIYTTPKNTG
jgi:hypothetical protein